MKDQLTKDNSREEEAITTLHTYGVNVIAQGESWVVVLEDGSKKLCGTISELEGYAIFAKGGKLS
ncbi:MAG: hypothetical protein AB8B97_27195 [Granulosicoccus sp.]